MDYNFAEKWVKDALDFGVTSGVLKINADKSYSFAAKERQSTAAPVFTSTSAADMPRHSYKPEEISGTANRDKNLDYLYKQAQISLGKTLSSLDIQVLYSLYDHYGFPVEVISLLLTHATGREKRSMRNIEKIAAEWADKGIMTVDDVDAHLDQLKKREAKETKIRRALGISERKPTESETKYISLWIEELKGSLDLVPQAYERTVNATGKLSMAYMDKILRNWAAEGIKTIAQLEQSDAEFKRKQGFGKPVGGGNTGASVGGEASKTAYGITVKKLAQIRQDNQAEQKRRRDEVYGKAPKIADIEQKLRENGAALSRCVLTRKNNFENIKRNIQLLNAEKANTLRQYGYSIDYLEDIYNCAACKDTGFIGAQRCGCLTRMINECAAVG